MEGTDTMQIFELAIYVPLLSMAGIFASLCVIDFRCKFYCVFLTAVPFAVCIFSEMNTIKALSCRIFTLKSYLIIRG